jgi:BTB/POZ domain-containing adapter for CUL3-mediated RhoA degradation protein
LRDDSVVLPDSGKDVADLMAEAKFYCIPELVEACKTALAKREKSKEVERICHVPLITTREEEAELIASTRKVSCRGCKKKANN